MDRRALGRAAAAMALLLLALAAGGLLPGPAARAQEASCRVHGRVLDDEGRPVAGIHVRLARGCACVRLTVSLNRIL